MCRFCWFLSIVLAIATAGLAWKFILSGETVAASDGRTGIVLEAGERTVNLERLLNLWIGLDPARDDDLPERLKREPISDGPSKGEVVDPERFEEMKLEYYAARGWTRDGRPLRATLARLDLDRLAPEHLAGQAAPAP